VIDVASKLGMRIVGFGGKDIVDGKRRFLLALTHQIWRYYVLQRLISVVGKGIASPPFLPLMSHSYVLNATSDKNKMETVAETEIVNWANQTVATNFVNSDDDWEYEFTDIAPRIHSLEDRKLSKSFFIAELLRALHPQAGVQPHLLKPGNSGRE